MIDRSVPGFGVHRNSDGSRRVTRKDENMVAADNAIDSETTFRKCLDDAFAADDRQPATGHVQAATVTLRMVGCASDGGAGACS
jgi:hypothetical protein